MTHHFIHAKSLSPNWAYTITYGNNAHAPETLRRILGRLNSVSMYTESSRQTRPQAMHHKRPPIVSFGWSGWWGAAGTCCKHFRLHACVSECGRLCWNEKSRRNASPSPSYSFERRRQTRRPGDDDTTSAGAEAAEKKDIRKLCRLTSHASECFGRRFHEDKLNKYTELISLVIIKCVRQQR